VSVFTNALVAVQLAFFVIVVKVNQSIACILYHLASVQATLDVKVRLSASVTGVPITSVRADPSRLNELLVVVFLPAYQTP